VAAEVERHVDRVIDAAELRPGMTLADIGAGEGVVAFRAINRIGPSLRVILTDVSAKMLRHAEAAADALGVRAQCSFLQCAAEELGAIADDSVDCVATRAVLAYVPDKPRALREFHRILRPGGRISLAEPIFQDEALYAMALKARVDTPEAGRDDSLLRLLHRWKSAQFPDTPDSLAASPIANYAERNLVEYAKGAGLTDIHLELHIDVRPSPIRSWSVFIGTTPHPWAPPLTEILAQRFLPDERQSFESLLRPIVESGRHVATDRIAYLRAFKPPQGDAAGDGGKP